MARRRDPVARCRSRRVPSLRSTSYPRNFTRRCSFPHRRAARSDWTTGARGEWIPALYGAGVEYRRPYALRHTGISRWLAANVPIFDVSRYAGTSLGQIERTYGHLVAGSAESTRARLDAFREYELSRLGVEQVSVVETESRP
jgi:integrase